MLYVAPTGFGPAISDLKGRRARPLLYDALRTGYGIQTRSLHLEGVARSSITPTRLAVRFYTPVDQTGLPEDPAPSAGHGSLPSARPGRDLNARTLLGRQVCYQLHHRAELSCELVTGVEPVPPRLRNESSGHLSYTSIVLRRSRTIRTSGLPLPGRALCAS